MYGRLDEEAGAVLVDVVYEPRQDGTPTDVTIHKVEVSALVG